VDWLSFDSGWNRHLAFSAVRREFKEKAQILTASDESIGFDIAVPGIYSVIADRGTFEGTLDGKSVSGPVRIEAGHHEIRRASGSGKLALLWAQAVAKGYNRFSPVEPDIWTDQD
jgi:hypothetical protein